MSSTTQQGSLVTIPILDVPATDEPGVASALAEPARLALLLDAGRRAYSPIGVRFADARSRMWAANSKSPYAGAVAQVDRVVHRAGAFLLNYSYEWGCTSAAADDRAAGGTTLWRTLDWPFDGLGRALVVVRQQGRAGRYISVTWPGFVGVLTGLAPGRFAGAINQPPLPLPGWGKVIGWLASRWLVNQSNALPPSHLLRLALDTSTSFAVAVALIRRTPVCIPAIFMLAGPDSGEAVVIERTQCAAFEPAEAVAANHWAAYLAPNGQPRNLSSRQRRAAMSERIARDADWSLDWLRSPILQHDTRLAMMANPRSGRLLAQGWEKSGPATAILDMHCVA